MDETRNAGRSGPQAMMDRDAKEDDGAKDVAPNDTEGTLDPICPEAPGAGVQDDQDDQDDVAQSAEDVLPGPMGWEHWLLRTREWWESLPEQGYVLLAQMRTLTETAATRSHALLLAAGERGQELLEQVRRGDLSTMARRRSQESLAALRARSRDVLAKMQTRRRATLEGTRERITGAFAVMATRLRSLRPPTRSARSAAEEVPDGVWSQVPAEMETDTRTDTRTETRTDAQYWHGVAELAERIRSMGALGLPRYRSRVSAAPLRWASAFLLVSMLVSLLLPAIGLLGVVADFNSIKALGDSGVHHLTAAEQDVSALTGGLGKSKTGAGSAGTSGSTGSTGQGTASSSLDPQAIARANHELAAAQQDFAQLRDRLDHPDWVLATGYAIPGLSDKLTETKALADVGYDASTMGVELSGAILPVLTRLHDKGIGSTDQLITQTDWNNIEHAATHAQTLLTNISAELSGVAINDLPISAKQKAQIAQVMVYLPTAQKALTQATQLLNAAGWLLGIGTPRHFLVQTLDRSELRASGGFTGNYGVLTIDGGKLDPFTLYNINDIEYGYKTNGWIFGRRPPSQYSWWPFANWGLRDSNLSADFPTTAKMNMQIFANEGQGQVDGVIQFSPVTIAHVLRVTGPITVPVFNETVTADNLEAKLHYYEEDPRGIAIQQRLFPTDHTHSLRKRFTQAVTQLLQDKVKTLPPSQLLEVGKQLLEDLQSKDLQIYFANPQLENLLGELRATGAIDTTPGIDGYMLVQANTSVAKSTPYVNVTQQDNVTLDDNGGATHHLSITMNYAPTGPIYGLPTYRDYMRIYVPPQARLISADGFDSGVPLGYAGGNPYPGGELSCPAGRYDPAQIKSLAFAGASGHLDAIGGPTETTSDVSGRAMWGGWVAIPQWCTARVTLSWYVPSVVNASGAPANAGPYTLLVQRQSGTFYTMNVTVHPSPKMAANGMQTATYSAQIADSLAFTLGKPNPISDAQFFNATSLSNLL